ncbi:FAD/NAD(P)-binding domain-containing protein [Aspergillus costaricaensis CBS 115574]|uniref:FAD/NAD(P)-binding domain-containing protein n=1 Tax=Aspergillus costaricaensis CBS 115574 TaxID=1448317 RepID=A0ACD1IEW2_9EURO|nr:FAD/NAD(P)-binding domain-containing protein [Aspergillus costaricaensis CBS 115574]RAK89155.1 FAD/NAD(P)-binding domain-containing protein [Aspergillus costaricaensis CBS 115574]
MPVYAPTRPDFNAIVVGAGFGGIYMCKKLTDQGRPVHDLISTDTRGTLKIFANILGNEINTEVQRAIYGEIDNLWTVSLSAGPRLTARYIVTAVGLLSKINYPDIPGLKTYEGEMYHTGNWPASYDFTGKRVGVIGNGSTGVQLVTALADQNVKQLLSSQRHP